MSSQSCVKSGVCGFGGGVLSGGVRKGLSGRAGDGRRLALREAFVYLSLNCPTEEGRG